MSTWCAEMKMCRGINWGAVIKGALISDRFIYEVVSVFIVTCSGHAYFSRCACCRWFKSHRRLYVCANNIHACLPSFLRACSPPSILSSHSPPTASLFLSLSPSLSLALSASTRRTNTLSLCLLRSMYHSHRLCIQRIRVCPPFPPFQHYFCPWLLIFALPSTELCARAAGGGGIGWLDRRKKRRENCAGRKDALVAAASDSISMNFTAEAVAAASSPDSLSKPAAAPCVGALLRGPVAASNLLPTLESTV